MGEGMGDTSEMVTNIDEGRGYGKKGEGER